VRAGSLTAVAITYLRCDTDTGEVTAQASEPGTESFPEWEEQAAAWLASLDPETIEREALHVGGMGESAMYSAIHRVIIPALSGTGPLNRGR
jgi:hypothetical protein